MTWGLTWGTFTELSTAATTMSLPYPSPSGGIRAGELLVICDTASSTTLDTCTGFTAGPGGTAGGSSPGGRFLYKFAAGGETGNVTLSGGNVIRKAQMLHLSGNDPAVIEDVTAPAPYSNASAATAFTIPGVTTVTDGCLHLVIGYANANTGTWTAPTNMGGGWTKQTDDPALVPSFGICWKIQDTAGATGNYDLVRSTSIRGGAAAIILRPGRTYPFRKRDPLRGLAAR